MSIYTDEGPNTTDIMPDPQAGVRTSAGASPRLSLAYLVGHYPGYSVTFIAREIELLRQLGVHVETASINAAQLSADGGTESEVEEQRRTFYVKTRSLALIALDHLSAFVASPLAYLRAAIFAIGFARTDLRQTIYNVFYFAEAVVLGQWMKRQGLDHVHVHFSASATVPLIASRMFPISYSISVHGPNEFYRVEEGRLREKFERARFLRCIGDFCRSQAMLVSRPEFWSNFFVSRLGVDPEKFAPRPEPRNERFNILCVGRLCPEKAQNVLVSAVHVLAQRGVSVHVDMAGDGDSRADVAEHVRSLGVQASVTMHGSVNQDRLRDLWAKADIFVLPSFAEGIPVALMEAMSMQIPVISTYVAGIPELIESGRNGILVPPADANALAGAIELLATSPRLRRELAQAGRDTILRTYNLRTNVEHLVSEFEAHLCPAAPLQLEAEPSDAEAAVESQAA